MVLESIREPIAIIGIGCRFPGSSGPREFWEFLRNGCDGVRDVPTDRWDIDALYDPDLASPGKTVSRRGGFIDHVDQFDWRAFRIPPREAKYMDPQHRLLLEVAWETIEDAGLPLEKMAGSRTGVFMGIMWNDYLRLQSAHLSQLSGYSTIGNAFAFAPNRISYFFDLKGPSVAFDNACASSLTSVHYACQSLWLGEADMALAGGVHLMLSPDISIMLSKTGILSPEGKCKTLDAKADGFVRGEGAGIVLLKPLSQLTPSDRVYALIRGSAIHHNGRNEWIMAANPNGQEAAIQDACLRAGIHPAEIDYVELNGTGLPKGDALEAKVLGEVVGNCEGRKDPCVVGSVKTNIGHLESAAGIAGIIKVALSLYNREIPPMLHLQEINPDIPLEALGLSVQRQLGPWPTKTGPNLAGVTSVAMSGINAHVLMEGGHQDSSEDAQTEQAGPAPAQLLPLSARSPEALSAFVQLFRDFFADEADGHPSFRSTCYTACVGRSHHEYRIGFIAHSREELIERLDCFLRGQSSADVLSVSGDLEKHDAPAGVEENEEITALISQCLERRDQNGTIIISLPSCEKEREAMLAALGILYTRGHTLDWSALYSGGERCVQLPTYPWQRERLWLDWIGSPKPLSDRNREMQLGEEPTGERRSLLRQIEEASPKEHLSLLLAHVRDQIADILGLDPSYSLPSHTRLFEAGLDSIGAVELMNRLQSSLGHFLSPTLIFDYPTIEDLSDYLIREVLSLDIPLVSDSKAQEDNSAEGATALRSFEQLSESDAEALLIKKLEAIEKDAR